VGAPDGAAGPAFGMMRVVTVPGDDLLRKLPLFRRLSPEDRARVAASSRVVHFVRGAHIFTEGDPASAFLAIVEGRVKVFKATPAGKELILEIFGAGDPLGAVAVYETVPFPASATALDDTTCLRIEQREFFALLEHHPAIVRGLLSGLTLRLAELTRRLAELTGARVDARFARLFLKLAQQIGRPDRGGVFVPMPLARQELADLTGTTIETAIRIMSRWQKDAVLHTEKDGFLIADRATLENVAAS
jgi:CRP-like cAMP-binding protein